MMTELFKLKLLEIMGRNHFSNGQLLAGEQGLQRNVKWVHIVEVTDLENLLNGNELILSTGVAWKDADTFLSVLKQLINYDASGLCLEIGTYWTEIPAEVLELADEHHFPIIAFDKQVQFVEITHDIHALIVNRQYQMISDLEHYSQTLNKRLLTIHTYEDILQFIFSSLDVQIIYKSKNNDHVFVPDIGRDKQMEVLQALKENNPKTSAGAPIIVFGQQQAELFIYSEEEPISEYDLLILDRTATALAQHLLKELYTGERKRVQELEWLNGWLEGDYSSEAILEYIQEQDIHVKNEENTVVIAKPNGQKEGWKPDITYLKLMFRSVFEQFGFLVFLIEKRQNLVFILCNKRKTSNRKERTRKAIKMMAESEFIKKQSSVSWSIGAGKWTDSFEELNKSYMTAKETIRIQNRMKDKEMYHLYEDLHLYRLISVMGRQVNLQEMANEYLEPIIEYDKQYNGRLLETLKAYMDCSGSKQETAKKLFIVRQTLYHRLQKIENLIGSDFMEREKRMAIEFMLLIHDYLQAPEQSISATKAK